MTSASGSEKEDWVVPAVLVGVIAMLGLLIVIAMVAQPYDDEGESTAGQLERWTSCLRSEGANVPLVETLHEGGIRITIDGSLAEEGIDEAALGPALDACEDEAPDGVQRVMALVDGASENPNGVFGWLEEFGEFDDFTTLGEVGQPREPRVEKRIERLDLAEICRMIEDGEIDAAALPRRLRRACA